MKHLDSGELRRMLDEPHAFDEETRAHAATCDACRERSQTLAADAKQTAGLLGGEPALNAGDAYDAVIERLASSPRVPRWYHAVSAAALAAAFVLALLFTPLGTYARGLLTVFEPQQFQPIRVSRADLRELHLLPQANDVGTQRTLRKAQRTSYATIADAQKHVPFTLLRPSALPPQFGTVHAFSVMSPSETTFTFSAAKARAFEKRSHKALPPMPADLDGTTVRLRTGQVFNAHYEAAPAHGKRAQRTASFELIEAVAPRVTSSGASLDVLERYLLSMPNVSPNLAAQLRALSDVQNTLPVPVLADKQSSRSIAIDGVTGLAIGDNTGLGAGVLWQKNGIIYAVAGPLSMDQVMSIAHGLR